MIGQGDLDIEQTTGGRLCLFLSRQLKRSIIQKLGRKKATVYKRNSEEQRMFQTVIYVYVYTNKQATILVVADHMLQVILI